MLDEKTKIIQKIKNYKSLLVQMDSKVTQFLLHRDLHRPPGQKELINEIRQYESKIHSFPNSEIQSWLDNLMNSLLFYERYWKRLFYEDEKKNQPNNQPNNQPS